MSYTGDYVGLQYFNPNERAPYEERALAHLKGCPMCGKRVEIWTQDRKHGTSVKRCECPHHVRQRDFAYEVHGGYERLFAELLVNWNLRSGDEDYYELWALKERLEKPAPYYWEKHYREIFEEACELFEKWEGCY